MSPDNEAGLHDFRRAWPAEHLDANLAFLAASLDSQKSETPRDTLRRYLAGGFSKQHLQAYINRPIYWLFSSGKQEAFQCPVYLHRYHEGTLSRMRTQYVVPLLGKLGGRISMLADTVSQATSSSAAKKAQKEKDSLGKQQAEGSRTVERLIDHYSLDVVIAVGYRVRSTRGTQFRQWATATLREYLTKGYSSIVSRISARVSRRPLSVWMRRHRSTESLVKRW